LRSRRFLVAREKMNEGQTTIDDTAPEREERSLDDTVPSRTAYAVRLLNGAKSVPREEWDTLARRGYHRHAWFVTAESCGAESRHVGIYDGDALVAIVPAYIEREALHGDLHERWYGAAHRIARMLGGGLRPVLSIGAPMSSCSDPLGDDALLTEDVVDDVMQLLEEEARTERVKAIVWPFVSESATSIRGAAAVRGYRESFAHSEAVLDVEWRSPEEYVTSRAKNVQLALRNELAWVHDQGIRVSWESDVRPHVNVFDALYRSSYLSQTTREADLPVLFLRKLAAHHLPGVRVQSAWRGEKLLAMTIALDGGGEMDLCLSAQADEARKGLLYQHCLVYDPVREAIAGGVTRIHLGPDALDAKLFRGARLESRYTLVRGCTAAARATLSVLAPMAHARNRSKQRRLLGDAVDIG
jgi:predicted N-acyltransferase